jgi:2-iminobutanoate/2-iminopropanoate deaminase
MKKSILFFLTFSFFILSCQQNQAPVYYISKRNIENKTPFSDAVISGNTLYLTGQIGKDHKTDKIVEVGIEAETRQALENIKAVLEANGSDISKIMKCTVILSDISNFSKMNGIYRTFFTENLLARTTFAASSVGDAQIEIEVITSK